MEKNWEALQTVFFDIRELFEVSVFHILYI